MLSNEKVKETIAKAMGVKKHRTSVLAPCLNNVMVSKLSVEEATITNMEFRKECNLPWQRWTRKTDK